jgi:hypothetical protein
MRRWHTDIVALFVMLSFLCVTVGADATNTSATRPFALQNVLEVSRKASQSVTLTLMNGELVVGSIVRIDKSRCFIRSSSEAHLREVGYSELEVVQTGDALYRVQPQYGQGVRPSRRTWMWRGIAIGAVFVFVFATGLNRA